MSATRAPKPEPRRSVSCDLAFCRGILPRVSRTFALSIELLPRALGDAVAIAYLLCRILDTIEDDETLDTSTRATLFAQVDAALDDASVDLTAFEMAARASALGGSSPDAELCSRASGVMACYHALPPRQRAAIAPPVHTMSRGMRDFATTIRPHAAPTSMLGLADLEELERYCYVVAGTVGELLDGLFIDDVAQRNMPSGGAPTRQPNATERLDLAVSFGLGLQLVNILKDAGSDFAQGRCFLPRKEAREAGLDLSHLLDDDARPAGRALLARVAERAHAHLDDAARYTLSWPAEASHIRLFCAVPLLLARATLETLLTSSDLLHPNRGPKISRLRVAQIVAAATNAAGDDDALARLLGTIAAAA